MICPLPTRSDRLLVDASLWSADLAALRNDVERVAGCADMLHLDASDGLFVAPLLFFPDLLAAVRPCTDLPLHVHLMAHRPAALAEAFLDAGADLVTVHAEADGAAEALARIRARGAAAGIAFALGTDPAEHRDLLRRADAIVMVGTPLGTAGTGMDPNAPRRIEAVRALLAGRANRPPVLADGGIRRETVPILAGAGADGVVAGSLLFKAPDPRAAAAFLRSPRPAVPRLCVGER